MDDFIKSRIEELASIKNNIITKHKDELAIIDSRIEELENLLGSNQNKNNSNSFLNSSNKVNDEKKHPIINEQKQETEISKQESVNTVQRVSNILNEKKAEDKLIEAENKNNIAELNKKNDINQTSNNNIASKQETYDEVFNDDIFSDSDKENFYEINNDNEDFLNSESEENIDYQSNTQKEDLGDEMFNDDIFSEEEVDLSENSDELDDLGLTLSDEIDLDDKQEANDDSLDFDLDLGGDLDLNNKKEENVPLSNTEFSQEESSEEDIFNEDLFAEDKIHINIKEEQTTKFSEQTDNDIDDDFEKMINDL
jgi:hypothetical protein